MFFNGRCTNMVPIFKKTISVIIGLPKGMAGAIGILLKGGVHDIPITSGCEHWKCLVNANIVNVLAAGVCAVLCSWACHLQQEQTRVFWLSQQKPIATANNKSWFCNPEAAADLSAAVPCSHRWMGGELLAGGDELHSWVKYLPLLVSFSAAP